MLRWYLYGVVYFTTTQRRTNAGRRLDDFVTATGWNAGVWDGLINAYGTWPAGRENVTGTADDGSTVPGLRFCYWTSDEAKAHAAVNDITQNWARYEDTNSFWAYTATMV